jgi:hypothetical protein
MALNVERRLGDFYVTSFPNVLLSSKDIGVNTERLLTKHTLFPIISFFSKLDAKVKILKHVMNIAKRNHAFKAYHLTLRWRKLQFCPECFREQLLEYGFCWMLINWELPLTECCTKHKIKLQTYNCNCDFKSLNFSVLIANLLSGTCKKCRYNCWPTNQNKATRKQLKISKWMEDFFKLEPLYLSQAIHKSLLEYIKAQSLKQRKTLLRYYFPRYGELKKTTIETELEKWSALNFPVLPEILFRVLIQCFETPNELRDFIFSSGREYYLDAYEVDKLKYLNENYLFTERYTLNPTRPFNYGSGRYFKIVL